MKKVAVLQPNLETVRSDIPSTKPSHEEINQDRLEAYIWYQRTTCLLNDLVQNDSIPLPPAAQALVHYSVKEPEKLIDIENKTINELKSKTNALESQSAREREIFALTLQEIAKCSSAQGLQVLKYKYHDAFLTNKSESKPTLVALSCIKTR